MLLVTVAALPVLAWIVLLTWRDGFWRADQTLPAAAGGPPPAKLGTWPEVVAVIPARDEAATIGEVVRRHCASAYPGRFSLIVMNDGSTDATRAIAEREGAGGPRPVAVFDVPVLPAGWSGKLWAIENGLARAREVAPDARFVLLADADIVHGPNVLARLVRHAAAGGRALVSVMARLDSRGPWARLLIPAFVFFFQKLYPFPAVNDPKRGTAAAAGGTMLVSRDALDAIGDVATIRGALIDDCALAARIKRGPPRRAIWLGFADDVHSLRDNRGLGSIWAMVARSAYSQLHRSPLLLGLTLAGMLLLHLAAPLALFSAPLHRDAFAAALAAAAWALMALAYRPTLARYGEPWWMSATLPVAALLYTAMTLSSAIAHWRGKGGAWKGRTYSAVSSGDW